MDVHNPEQPDIVILCKDGVRVPAVSCLLLLTSAPLRPAIKLALQGAAGTSRDTDAEHDKRRSGSSLPMLKMDNDDAGTWTLALQFIDPMRLERPEIDWTNVRPLLRLSHKYELKVPLQLCTAFLTHRITRSRYMRLPDRQLANLRHWLSVASRLGLKDLHSNILECLHDCTSKALQSHLLRQARSAAASRAVSDHHHAPSRSSQPGSSLASTPRGSYEPTHQHHQHHQQNQNHQQNHSAPLRTINPLHLPPHFTTLHMDTPRGTPVDITRVFKLVWSGCAPPPGQPVTACSSEQLRAALQCAEKEELVGLLEGLLLPVVQQ